MLKHVTDPFFTTRRDQETDVRLTSFVRDDQTDPWYRCIGKTLLGEKTENGLIPGTGESPCDALTAYRTHGVLG